MRLIWRLTSDTIDAWLTDDGASMGAALAYYALFSLAPLLVITIAGVSSAFGAAGSRQGSWTPFLWNPLPIARIRRGRKSLWMRQASCIYLAGPSHDIQFK
jgi:hypothetical protein